MAIRAMVRGGLFATLLLLSPITLATVSYSESISGDISTATFPFPHLGVLGIGANTIQGQFCNQTSTATFAECPGVVDFDIFGFTLLPGTALSSISFEFDTTLLSPQTSAASFQPSLVTQNLALVGFFPSVDLIGSGTVSITSALLPFDDPGLYYLSQSIGLGCSVGASCGWTSNYIWTLTVTDAASVLEPSALALFCAAFAGLGFSCRRRVAQAPWGGAL